MFRKVFKNRKGEVYIPLMIALFVLSVAMVTAVSVGSSMNNKMWLDEKLDDIGKIVASTGCIRSDEITAITEEITGRFGGTLDFEGDFLDDDKTVGKVQLNDVVYVTYKSDQYIAIQVGDWKIYTPVDMRTMAVSNVYWKPISGMVD